MTFLDHCISAFFWYGCLQVFAFAVAPTLSFLLPHLPDRGYSLSKPLGLLAIGFSTWLFAVITGSDANAGLIITILGFWIGLGYWFHSKNKRASSIQQRLSMSQLLKAESIFAFAFVGFLAIKSFQPEIFWGEKPMDFTFLNFFIRNTQLPPQDPWAAGASMKYYYLGTFLFACVHKVTGISSALGYNFALATVPAFSSSVLYSLFSCFGLRFRVSLAGCIFFQFVSSWEGVKLLFTGSSINFDQFWATTRILKPAMATEYPLWSFLFGDLHAHFIAVPFVLTIITLVCSLLVRRASPLATFTTTLVVGSLFGPLIVLNTWDVLTSGLFVIAGAFFLFHEKPAERLRLFISMLAAAALGAILCLPFLKGEIGQGAGKGFELQGFTTFLELFRCLGMFTIPILSIGIFFLATANHRPVRSGNLSRKTLFFATLLLPLAPTFWLTYQEGFRVGAMPGLLTGVTLTFLGTLLFSSVADKETQGAGFLTAAAGILTTFFEVLWLNDRMNTLFKVYYLIWSCLSLSTFLLVARLYREVCIEWRKLGGFTPVLRHKKLLSLAAALSVLALLPAGFTAITNVWVMTTFQRVQGPRPTIDGLAYLKETDVDEYNLASYIQRNIKGTPIVLEAQGQSYDLFTRVATRTGLPTVLGWDYHVQQRGVTQTEIEKRKEDIKTMYSSTDLAVVTGLLKKYHVRYIVIGEKERLTYPAEGLAKFKQQPDHFATIFAAPKATLLEVF